MSNQKIIDLQNSKIYELIKHSYETIPYYRRVMQERDLLPCNITSLEDLKKLPVLNRGILLQEKKNLLSSKADYRTLQTNYSSGSTGTRAEFKQDAEFRLWMRAHQLRTYSWCGDWNVGDPFMLLWGSEIYWNLKQIIDKFDNCISNRREYNSFDLSPVVISKFVEAIVKYKPKIISSYTNALYLVAKEMRNKNITVPALKAIQATSEPITPRMKEQLETIFNCPVYDKYGMRETNIISHEAPIQDGMLIQSENAAVEINRSDNSPCSADEKGLITVTTLNNYSMPLIRYQTSDIAAISSQPSKSGLPFPVMTHVQGRLQDLIITPEGGYVDSYLFSYLFMRQEEIHWFQVIQWSLTDLHIKLYTPNGITDSKLKELTEKIKVKSAAFQITYEKFTAMPTSPTGKFRLCVSELTQESLGNLHNG